MDAKEITRLEVMQRQKEAATLLGLSVRQVKRVWQKYRQQAAKGSGERQMREGEQPSFGCGGGAAGPGPAQAEVCGFWTDPGA